MQRNKVHHVYTVDCVAKELGGSEDLIHYLTLGLEPEDGVIRVYGIGDDAILAFSDEGVQEVRLLVEEFNRLKPTNWCQLSRQASLRLFQTGTNLRASVRDERHKVRIPTQAGRVIRREAGRGSDVKPAGIPT